MKPIINEVGNTYGRLTVLSFSHMNADKKACFVCLCSCGKEMITSGKLLRSGNTKSCGCISHELISGLNRTHGDCSGGKTKEYHTWRGIIGRCEDVNHKNYDLYGGRGIRVCKRWKNYANFLSDMGRKKPGYTIERIDSNGDYKPSNCKWATMKQQNNNKRNNHILEHNGKKMTISQWSDEIGVKQITLLMRIRRGWSAGEAISGYRNRP